MAPDASLNDSASTGPAAGGGGVAGPSETLKATALPAAALEPPVGTWLMTEPAATAEFAVVTVLVSPWALIALCAAACVKPTTFGTVTCAGGGGGTPALISTAAKFHWSAVGAVVLIPTFVPEATTGALVACTQKVSPDVLSTA